MDDKSLVEHLRRRSEAGIDQDPHTLYAEASTQGAKRRRRRRLATATACAVLLLASAGVVIAATRGSEQQAGVEVPPADRGRNTSITGLQIRPVIGQVAPATNEDPNGATAVAGCDLAAVTALGPSAPTTSRESIDPTACVLLTDPGGSRYLLGPAALDEHAVASAKKEFQSGSGWGVTLKLTPSGSAAFDSLAQAQFHKQIAVVSDGALLSEPLIQPTDETFSSFGGTVRLSVGNERDATTIVQSTRTHASAATTSTAARSTGHANCQTSLGVTLCADLQAHPPLTLTGLQPGSNIVLETSTKGQRTQSPVTATADSNGNFPGSGALIGFAASDRPSSTLSAHVVAQDGTPVTLTVPLAASNQ
jgi:hypothetical protein